MESTSPVTLPMPRYHRWLPYFAVLQTDIRQTLRSWIFRLWLLVTVGAAVGYILYKLGIYREAGLIQKASILTTDLIRGIIYGSMAMIAMLTVSSIASERGTLADSVLCRGISRSQYYLAKWHARLIVILGTFSLISLGVFVSAITFINEELSWRGGLTAILLLTMLLASMVSMGVAISGMCHSSIMGISILLLILYGGSFALQLLPDSVPSPDRLLAMMPTLLRGQMDSNMITTVLTSSLVLSLATGFGGLIGFTRRDL
ncbi:ABC transporter permease [Tuwongella immobilis]|uniref:: ABC2_membrane_4 n=1 Tax=Tuwongella immobilis TaxID=692036 RepID=A0A6C2YSH1_9BACT|nr:ABC transporter permease [Tuwongella immobilis]VIP04638.1 : ABC2_membrane_4 [Tuwongella immobilis]VTS06637.1 : ABC2_membrane_4 [Tuwongella immobilis]